MEKNIKNVLSWTIKICLFAVPFIPLYIASNMFFPFITGKAFAFRLLIELALAAWLILVFFYKEYWPKKNNLIFAVGIFLLITTLATVIGVNPLRSFWSNFERMEGLAMYLHLFAYFLMLGTVFKKNDWTILFNLFIVSGFSEGLYAVLQALGKIPSPQGGFRVDGTIGNPAYLAAYLLFVVGFCLLFFLGKSLKNESRDIQKGFWFSSTFFAIVFILTILRGQGVPMGLPNPGLGIWFISTALLTLFLLASSYLTRAESSFWKFYYGIAGLFSLFIIYLTASRGPVLGIIIALIVAGIVYLILKKPQTEKERVVKRNILIGFIVIIVIISALWGMRNTSFVSSSPVLSRLTNLSFSDKTIIARFEIWEMSWRAFLEKPVLGWGPDNYVAVFAKYYQPSMWNQEPWFDRSHNVIFDWLINAGALGLLSYLAIFFLALKELYKNLRDKKIVFEEYILVISIFIAYFFQNLFVFDNIATYVAFFAILAWIYSMAITQAESDERGQRSQVRVIKPQSLIDINYSPLVAAIVLIIASFYFYFIVGKPLMANINLIRAIAYSDNFPVTAFEYYKKVFEKNTFLGRDEARGQFTGFVINAIQNPDLDSATKQEMVELASLELGAGIEQNPLDPRPLMYTGVFYQNIGQMDKAIELMERAKKLSPLKQDIGLALGMVYLNQKQFDKALPILLEMFNEDQTNLEARVVLAGGYILTGDQSKADQLLIDGFGKVDVPQSYLANIYYSINKNDRLLGIWKALVEVNPNNAGYLKSLAGAYLLVSQKDNAIETLKKVIVLDPSLEQQINDYINQIQTGQLQ